MKEKERKNEIMIDIKKEENQEEFHQERNDLIFVFCNDTKNYLAITEKRRENKEKSESKKYDHLLFNHFLPKKLLK